MDRDLHWSKSSRLQLNAPSGENARKCRWAFLLSLLKRCKQSPTGSTPSALRDVGTHQLTSFSIRAVYLNTAIIRTVIRKSPTAHPVVNAYTGKNLISAPISSSGRCFIRVHLYYWLRACPNLCNSLRMGLDTELNAMKTLAQTDYGP